jgi:sulfotransferase family protein
MIARLCPPGPCERPRTGFVIWFNERSGSTHLSSLLDSHPQISCWREVFYRGEAERVYDYFDRSCLSSTNEFLEHFFEYRWGPEGTRMLIEHDVSVMPRAVGFKLKYQQLARRPDLEGCLELRPQLKIIHLVRQNLLATLVSSHIVDRVFRQFGAANITKEMSVGELSRCVALNPRTIVAELSELEARIAGARESMRRFPMLEITYEDLLRAPAGTCRTILEFLGVESTQSLRSRYKKIMPIELRNSIINYADIEFVLNGTRFGDLLKGWTI